MEGVRLVMFISIICKYMLLYSIANHMRYSQCWVFQRHPESAALIQVHGVSQAASWGRQLEHRVRAEPETPFSCLPQFGIPSQTCHCICSWGSACGKTPILLFTSCCNYSYCCNCLCGVTPSACPRTQCSFPKVPQPRAVAFLLGPGGWGKDRDSHLPLTLFFLFFPLFSLWV